MLTGFHYITHVCTVYERIEESVSVPDIWLRYLGSLSLRTVKEITDTLLSGKSKTFVTA